MGEQRRLSVMARSVLKAVVLAVVVAVVGLTALTVVPGATPTASAAPTISRADVIERADYWFRASNGQVAGVEPFGRDLDNTAAEPGGANRYRTDCSGMVQMAWRLDAGRYTDSRNIQNGDVSVGIDFASLQAGDILATNGHVTMFHQWVDQAAGTYIAYDFGGGGANKTPGKADGRMEHKQYTLSIRGDVAYRAGDDRPYRAFRAVNITGGGSTPAPPPPPPGGANPNLPWVVKGQHGAAVLCVQKGLNGATGAGIAEDADFGSQTQSAVKNLQRFARIEADGKVGPQTGGVLAYFYDQQKGSGAWAATGCFAHVPAK